MRQSLTLRFAFLAFLLGFGLSDISGQIEFKLQLMPDTMHWGVYATHNGTGGSPSDDVELASGQATVIAPTGFMIGTVTSYNGNWSANARANGPAENPTRDYISFGYQSGFPFDAVSDTMETLLFTFEKVGACPDTLYLMSDGDPFARPNSFSTNPENDFQAIDRNTFAFYLWERNYAFSAWSCNDCDGDGILDALEDTNGDGNYDPISEDINGNGVYDMSVDEDIDGNGWDILTEDFNENGLYDMALDEDLDGDGRFDLVADSSELCNACDPIHPEAAIMRGDTTMCAAEDNTDIFVDVTGGWNPYTVVYENAAGTQFTELLYESGDPINLTLAATDTFTIVQVTDSTGCTVDSIFGNAIITIEGPLSITTQPTAVTECVGNPTSFTAPSANGGASDITYNWQVMSTANAPAYSNVINGTPYSTADSDVLNISDVDGLDQYQYRLAISTEYCDTVFSNWVTLTVEGPITVDLQPRDTSICSYETAQFYSTAIAPLGTISGQWEYCDPATPNTWLPVAGADYAGGTTGTLTVSNVTNYYDFKYRRAYTTPTCAVVNSDEAILTVEGPIAIVDQPDDISECSAQGLEFIVGVTNTSMSADAGTIRYQWQLSEDTTQTWTNIQANTTYGGPRIDTLTVDVSDSLNGTWYRVLVWTDECNVIISDSAELSISGVAAFDTHPIDVDICDGNDTLLTVNATTQQGFFTYHWQVSKDSGATWIDTDVDGGAEGQTYGAGTDPTLTISDVSYLQNGFWYRAQARTTDCIPVSSQASEFRVEGPLSVNIPPVNDTVCWGEQASFDVEITNPGSGVLEYQWQVKSALAGGWNDIPKGTVGAYTGAGTPNFIIDTQVGGNDGDSIRVVVNTPNCASIISVGVRMVIEGPLTITDSPNDTTVCSGNPVVFYSEFTNDNDGADELRWELMEQGASGPTEIEDTGFAAFSGQDTRILTLNDVVGRDSTQFRLKVRTGDCDWIYSDWAVLTVEGPFTIDAGGDPIDVTTCDGATAFFWVDATNDDGGGLLYEWEYKDRNSALWVLASGLNPDTIIGGMTDTLSVINVTNEMNGDSVRVSIYTATCRDFITTSSPAQLTIEAVVDIDTEPAPDTICSGQTANFNIAYSIPGGGAGMPALQWQVSTNGLGGNLGNWADVSGAVYSGDATTNLTITAPDHTYNTYRYRVAYTVPTCGTLYTDDAVLTVEGAISVTVDPIDVQSCDSQDEVFFVSTQNLGGGTDVFQWQLNDGSGFVDIDNSTDATANYQGFTSEVLAIGQIGDYMNGYEYQLVMNTGDCAAVVSTSAELTVEGPLEFTNQPDDITVCSGSDTIMVVEFTNTGNNGIAGTSIQWLYSENGGNTYNAIAPSDVRFSGETNDTLTINDVANMYDWWFVAEISTTTCPIERSEPAILTVEGPIAGTDPMSITDCNDNSIRFTSVVTNAGSGNVDLQWQTWDGAMWIDMANDTSAAGMFTGVRTDTMSVADMDADLLNGSQYRLKMSTSTCMTQYTAAATLTIEGPLTITDSPNDTIVCSGMPAEFYMAVDLGQGGTANYQWQVSTDGTTYNDIDGTTHGGIYSTFNTRILNLSDVANRYGHFYRCAVNTTYCDVKYTDPARLTVEGPLTITNQPDSLIACRNEAYFFQTEVANGGAGVMSFQWEVLNVPAGTWSDEMDDTWVHGTQTTLLQLDSMDIMESRGDTVFRLRIDLPTCNSFYSDVVLLHVVSDTLGFCDFDLDGEINDIDEDDDNDGLDDIWENSCLTYRQFNPNTDGDPDNNTDGEEDWDGDGISNGEETDGDGILDGDPCDPCDPLISSQCFGIALEVDVLLFGGAFDGKGTVSDIMSDDMRQKDTILPVQEPYTNIFYMEGQDTITPFKHFGPGGGEIVSDPATVFGDKGDSSIIDWVFIELRHANKIDSVVATRSALVTKAGDVVDVDGKSHVTFDTTVVAGEYYVAIRHRNHLGAMTVDAPELSPMVRQVDFRDTSVTFQGDEPMYEDPVHGKNYLWAGDLRPDGRVIYQGPQNDIVQILLRVLTDPDNNEGPGGTANANFIPTGYLLEDYDLNGEAIYQGPLNDRTMVLFATVLRHPGNVNKLANYVVVEQLP